MFYLITGKNWNAAVVCREGIAVQVTENFEWAAGLDVDKILEWADERGMRWSASEVVPRGLELRDATRARGEGK
jgi:hypothetical protein